MPNLPARFAALIITFAPLFVHRSRPHAQVLLADAILAPGRRTVASVLRITGRVRDRRFTAYHRVLNRAPWSARDGALILLGHLVRSFAPRGPVIVCLDDTIERRWGQRISARGIYRNPVRSSHSHFVKTSGLRWISVMLLAPVPWAGRMWALPFLTVLVPSERYNAAKERRQDAPRLRPTARPAGPPLAARPRPRARRRQQLLVAALSACPSAPRAHRDHAIAPGCGALRSSAPHAPGTIGRPRKAGRRLATLAKVATDVTTAWQAVGVEHWYGGKARDVLIASATAVWRHNGLPVVPMRWVLIRDPIKPDAPAQALLCTDLDRTPQEIVTWFVRRW